MDNADTPRCWTAADIGRRALWIKDSENWVDGRVRAISDDGMWVLLAWQTEGWFGITHGEGWYPANEVRLVIDQPPATTPQEQS